MADIEFVIEAPQTVRRNKKRPRLVTSCDHCRVKKIKCVQQPTTGRCEACTAAHLPCQYRDREEYFAERTRMLSGSSSSSHDSSSGEHSRAQLSAINASSSSPGSSPRNTPRNSESPAVSPEFSDSSASYSQMDFSTMDFSQLFSSDFDAHSMQSAWQESFQTPQWAPQRSTSLPNVPSITTSPLPSPSPSLASGLFDPAEPNQPHPKLMMEFIRVFFEKYGTAYPFLFSEEIYEQFLHHKLPPLLANAIAASAVRYSTIPEIKQVGYGNATNVYCQTAKSLLPQGDTPACLVAVHSLILLSWVEYKRGRHAAFNTYAPTAIRFATALGITHDSLPQLAQMLDQRAMRVLLATHQGLQYLNRALFAAEHQNASASAPVPMPMPLPAGSGSGRAHWDSVPMHR
ncbi:hypothetical protein BD413DRAFT_477149 [Trametes elegans]|nr:hypothetical protein BD413DRAFT_477149 [Trametes elegans]